MSYLTGVQIQDSGGELGNILVANKKYEAGDTVLPILVWDSSNPTGVLDSFISASQDIKFQVLEMFHPPLESSNDLLELSYFFSTKPSLKSLSKEVIHKLLMIANINCHAYLGGLETGGGAKYTEKILGKGESNAYSDSRSALFSVASKAAHSCNPNVTYSSQHGPFLRYSATRNIEIGDQITFAYIGELYKSTRDERRAKLFSEKYFTCRCVRCSGIDDMRGLRCLISGCNGVAYRSDCSSPDSSCWACSLCHEKATDWAYRSKIEIEKKLQYDLSSMISIYERTRNFQVPSTCRQIYNSAISELSPTHNIAIKTLDFLAMWSASQVSTVQQILARSGQLATRSPYISGMVNIKSLRIDSAKSIQLSIGIRQCIAAGCTLGTCDVKSHPFVHDLITEVLWALKDYMAAGPEGRLYAAYLATHCISSFRCQYHSGDTDLIELEDLIKSVGPIRLDQLPVTVISAFAAVHETMPTSLPLQQSVMAVTDVNKCANCHLKCDTMKSCSACKKISYCGAQCQKLHWKVHKPTCRNSMK